MTAKNLMNPHPMTLSPSDTVAMGADCILEHHLRHLPVVDDQGRYPGTFSIYSQLKLTLPKAARVWAAITLIGASANLVVAGFVERAGQPIRFVTFLLLAFPLMLMSVAISAMYLYWRYL